MNIEALVETLRADRGLAHKRDIEGLLKDMSSCSLPGAASWLGDDCAVISANDRKLLFAIEGFMNEFVAHDPWFAGWCGVMVNLSDIAAMGGRALAVVDALWSNGEQQGKEVIAGMMAASRAYGVPIVGGHSNTRTQQAQLAVAIIGEAKSVLSSYTATPGESLVMAVDLKGRYREPFNNWDAATSAPPGHLKSIMELMPTVAEKGLASSAKDISQAGLIGTVLMLIECSGIGPDAFLNDIPRPKDVPLERWLRTFPSFGYVLTCPVEREAELLQTFQSQGVAAAGIGNIRHGSQLNIVENRNTDSLWATFWDIAAEPLMGIHGDIRSHHRKGPLRAA